MKQKGFTLIEILVVIAIVAFLASVFMVALNIARIRARDAKRQTDSKQLQKAVNLYYQDKGLYPPSSAGVNAATGIDDAMFVAALVPAYLQTMPVDPSCPAGGACNYQYIYKANQTDYGLKVPFEATNPAVCKFMSPAGDATWFSSLPVCNF